jgi:hypothetical protein
MNSQVDTVVPGGWDVRTVETVHIEENGSIFLVALHLHLKRMKDPQRKVCGAGKGLLSSAVVLDGDNQGRGPCRRSRGS